MKEEIRKKCVGCGEVWYDENVGTEDKMDLCGKCGGQLEEMNATEDTEPDFEEKKKEETEEKV